MNKTKLTAEQKLYSQSMIEWFKSMEIDSEWQKTEMAYFIDNIEYNKKKLALLKSRFIKANKRYAIAKKQYSDWLKQVNKK